MKKQAEKALVLLASVALILTSALNCAADADYDTLPDWELKIAVPEGTEGILDTGEGNYYIYPDRIGAIPYVMIRAYPWTGSAGEFLEEHFLDHMRGNYPDLTVSRELSSVVIGGKDCQEVDFSYTVEAYTVRDRRVFWAPGGRFYMFASKEVEALGLTTGTLLEDVVQGSVFLGEEKNESGTSPEPAGQQEQTGGQNTQAENADVPLLILSDWVKTASDEYTDTWSRTVDVSDGGNYLLSYSVQHGDGEPSFYYDVLWEGTGTQNVYTGDLGNITVRMGKLFRLDTLDETALTDIDTIYTDRITVREATGSSFLLICRMHGGEYDGKVRSFHVLDGEKEFDPDYYAGLESIDLLGVYTFRPEDKPLLSLGQLQVEKGSSSYEIRQNLVSDAADGIGIIRYRNGSGKPVSQTAVIMNGTGRVTAYDFAGNALEVRTGYFEVVGFRADGIEAGIFEDA